MTKIYAAKGYEFFTSYDNTAGVYELWLDDNAETYIGCFDSVGDALAYAKEYAKTRGEM